MTFISEVRAQETATDATTAPQEAFSFTSFVPLVLIFAIFYFLIIRPQSKKIKEHQAMVNALKRGDKVITTGGIIGVITRIDEKEELAEIEIADGVTIKIVRGHVSQLVDKKEITKK